MNNGNVLSQRDCCSIESAFSIESSEGGALSVMIQLKHLKLLR